MNWTYPANCGCVLRPRVYEPKDLPAHPIWIFEQTCETHVDDNPAWLKLFLNVFPDTEIFRLAAVT